MALRAPSCSEPGREDERSNVGHSPTHLSGGRALTDARTCRNRNKSSRAEKSEAAARDDRSAAVPRPRSGKHGDQPNQRGHLESEKRRESSPLPWKSRQQARRAAFERRRAKAVAGPWSPVVEVPEGEQLPYIRCCAHNDRRPQSYWVYTWEAADPSKRIRSPYRCGSWRCPYGCRMFAGHLLYSRIVESFEGFDPNELVMIVLTLPSLDHAKAKAGVRELADLYRDLLVRKERFWSRMKRLHAKRGWDWIGSQYVAVLEQHKSGVPHVNLLVRSPQWAHALRSGKPKEWLFDPELQAHAEATGWGWRCTAEPVREKGFNKLAGYIVKLAGRSDAMHGELAKECQLPLQAPRHFRRLRAGKRFLVPRRRKEGWTGTIVRRKWTEDGDELVLPLVLSRDPEYMQRVRECCDREQQLAREDEDKRAKVIELQKAGVFGLSTEPEPYEVSSHFWREYAQPPPPHDTS